MSLCELIHLLFYGTSKPVGKMCCGTEKAFIFNIKSGVVIKMHHCCFIIASHELKPFLHVGFATHHGLHFWFCSQFICESLFLCSSQLVLWLQTFICGLGGGWDVPSQHPLHGRRGAGAGRGLPRGTYWQLRWCPWWQRWVSCQVDLILYVIDIANEFWKSVENRYLGGNVGTVLIIMFQRAGLSATRSLKSWWRPWASTLTTRRKKRMKQQQWQSWLRRRRTNEWWGGARWKVQRRPKLRVQRSLGGRGGVLLRVSKSSARHFALWERKRAAAQTRALLFLLLHRAAATRSLCHSSSSTGIVYFKAAPVSLHGYSEWTCLSMTLIWPGSNYRA